MPPGPGSPCSTHFCAPIRPPPGPCAHASRCRAPRPAPKSCASTPTPPRCVTSVSRSATRSDLRQTSCRSGATALSRPPSLDPSRILLTQRRGWTWLVDPNGLAAGLKACAGEGDPVSAAAKAAALAFSALPDAPAAEAEILALWVFDMRHRHPAALAAARAADRDENPGSDVCGPGRRATAKARRPRLAKRRRRRDRARRRRGPRPRRRSLAPLKHPDRRRAQTPLETGPENRRPAARPRIASRPPKRPATRR